MYNNLMNIKIITVGKIKEAFMKSAIAELEKRLKSYCTLSIIEVVAENIYDETLSEKYKESEADKILQYVKPDSYVITLEIEGKNLSSEELASRIKEISNSGINELIFIIGGANGLHKKVSDISNLKLSFSKMTFTHQLIRLILIEQIYRSYKINLNEPYHR